MIFKKLLIDLLIGVAAKLSGHIISYIDGKLKQWRERKRRDEAVEDLKEAETDEEIDRALDDIHK